MKREVLILDFDGVIVITQYLMIQYVEEKYLISIKPEDLDAMSIVEVVNKKTNLNLTFESFYWDFTENFSMSFDWHREVDIMPFADQVIPELTHKYNVYLSTARNYAGFDVINYILRRHGISNLFKGYHFIYHFNKKYEFIKRPKMEFISSFGGKASFFMDDSVYEIEETKKIIPSLLFDPYGHKSVEGTWTVNSWLEAAQILL